MPAACSAAFTEVTVDRRLVTRSIISARRMLGGRFAIDTASLMRARRLCSVARVTKSSPAMNRWQGSRQLPRRSRTAGTERSSTTRLESNDWPTASSSMREVAPPLCLDPASLGRLSRRWLAGWKASLDASPASAASTPAARSALVTAPPCPAMTGRPSWRAWRYSSVTRRSLLGLSFVGVSGATWI